jgi:hypothetical protein
MTEPHVIPLPAPELQGKSQPALETVAAPLILITEQQVAFSTAAAQAVQPRDGGTPYASLGVRTNHVEVDFHVE